MLIDNLPNGQTGLTSKVAVITGAGRGIGREAARVLARFGARVVIAERAESGAETAGLIQAEGREALFVQTDVADEASVAHLYDTVQATYGRADILINNAIVTSFGPLWEHAVADWDRVMAVNLRGAFLCIRAFLPQMLARREGVVVTMESADGMPYMAPYQASKAGLRSLALSLAAEVGEASGVSVFCFGPGMVDTPGLAEALERLPAYYKMSRAEFIEQSGVAMVSAETCAAGLAGVVLHARQCHGQEVGYATGLALLGLDGAAGQPSAPVAAGFAASPAAAAPPALSTALALNRKLEGILQENIREYSELTLFQRPIVRRMFQQGTGFKVEDWLERAQAFSRYLEQVAAEDGWREAEVRAYVASLERLAKFIHKQESDARGFFRNAEQLNRALEALQARRAVVTDLAAQLEAALAARG
ncbi:MAG: SDR family NAD(P)-dependent oxidoreductase [Bacillota bacterium]